MPKKPVIQAIKDWWELPNIPDGEKSSEKPFDPNAKLTVPSGTKGVKRASSYLGNTSYIKDLDKADPGSGVAEDVIPDKDKEKEEK